MKCASTLAVLAALLHSASAVYWQQFYNTGCTGTVENDGTELDSAVCVPQQGASVSFTKSGTAGCAITVYNDKGCTDFAYNVGDGCQNFGGTGKSFLIICGE